VPAGTFDAGSPNFTLGLVEVSTRYRFSQRRTNIGDLVNTQVQAIVKAEIKKKLQEIGM